MIFQRDIYQKMLRWKRVSKGDTALLIEGARRVGKSTIVKAFAEKEYESYILIDFGDTKASFTKDIKRVFTDSRDYEEFFTQLQLATGTELHKRKSVIVFDEVQKYIQAREMIKYLVQDGRYDYIETGSLISIKKNSRKINIPSEEEKIEMFPMTFPEFLIAAKQDLLLKEITHSYKAKKALSDLAHKQAMWWFRTYMAVGGMPKAVEAYLETKDYEQVDRIKKAIIDLYREDLENISRKSSAVTPLIIYDNIQSLYSNHSFEIIASSFSNNTRLYTALNNVDELEKSKVVNVAHNIVNIDPSLSLGNDMSGVKVYSGDTGLLVTKMYMHNSFVENKLYKSIILDKLSSNEGFLYENVVAQMLRASGHELKYNNFYIDGSNNQYSIDFLIGNGRKISPIEVKSSHYQKHASLDEFKKKYHSIIDKQYIIYSKNLKIEKDIVFLPVYMTFLI